jgi:hypothetical protein
MEHRVTTVWHKKQDPVLLRTPLRVVIPAQAESIPGEPTKLQRFVARARAIPTNPVHSGLTFVLYCIQGGSKRSAMDQHFKEMFVSQWKKYWAGAPLPICYYYTDRPRPEDVEDTRQEGRCLICNLGRGRSV